RVDTFKDSLQHWAYSPVIGHGASSAGSVVDNYYMRVMIESGILGLFSFLLLLFAVVRSSFQALAYLRKSADDNFTEGLIVGFVAGLAGLLVHSLGAATFILIRIMEPFWFLAGLVIMAPEIEAESNARVEGK
ncbi:MAG: hypothetical protein PHO30_06835, partial [Candidatus Omnitrophica bacterium]|nr:hypothetical protein [Candidatus Omnitrophota bacterium]